MSLDIYTQIGPGDTDFKALENVAYRAFRKAGLSVEQARYEAESYAYTASELLNMRVEEQG